MTFVLAVELELDEDEAVAIARGLARQFDAHVRVVEKDEQADPPTERTLLVVVP